MAFGSSGNGRCSIYKGYGSDMEVNGEEEFFSAGWHLAVRAMGDVAFVKNTVVTRR